MIYIVWYHIELDKIFLSLEVDTMFYGLQNIAWNKIECLGVL